MTEKQLFNKIYEIDSTNNNKTKKIYSMLKYKQMPFRKIKICRTQQT